MRKGVIHLILFFIGVVLVNCNTDEIDKIVEDVIDDTVEPNWKNPTICDTVCCKEDNENLLKNGGLERWQTFPFLQATDWLLFDNEVNVKRNYTIFMKGNILPKCNHRKKGIQHESIN